MRTRLERALFALLAVAAAASALIWPVGARLDPGLAVTYASQREQWGKARTPDPWGRSLVWTRKPVLINGQSFAAWRAHSRGPDGIDQRGGGDDVLPLDEHGARYLTWLHVPRLLLEACALLGMAIVSTRLLPRSGQLREELLVTGTLASSLLLLAAVLHGGVWPGEASLAALVSAPDLPLPQLAGGAPLAVTLAILAMLALPLAWLRLQPAPWGPPPATRRLDALERALGIAALLVLLSGLLVPVAWHVVDRPLRVQVAFWQSQLSSWGAPVDPWGNLFVTLVDEAKPDEVHTRAAARLTDLAAVSTDSRLKEALLALSRREAAHARDLASRLTREDCERWVVARDSTLYYSLGPNRRDDLMRGDDVPILVRSDPINELRRYRTWVWWAPLLVGPAGAVLLALMLVRIGPGGRPGWQEVLLMTLGSGALAGAAVVSSLAWTAQRVALQSAGPVALLNTREVWGPPLAGVFTALVALILVRGRLRRRDLSGCAGGSIG